MGYLLFWGLSFVLTGEENNFMKTRARKKLFLADQSKNDNKLLVLEDSCWPIAKIRNIENVQSQTASVHNSSPNRKRGKNPKRMTWKPSPKNFASKKGKFSNSENTFYCNTVDLKCYETMGDWSDEDYKTASILLR